MATTNARNAKKETGDHLERKTEHGWQRYGGTESLDAQYPGGTLKKSGHIECLRVANETRARTPGDQCRRSLHSWSGKGPRTITIPVSPGFRYRPPTMSCARFHRDTSSICANGAGSIEASPHRIIVAFHWLLMANTAALLPSGRLV